MTEVTIKDHPTTWKNFRDDFIKRNPNERDIATGLTRELLKWNAILKTDRGGVKASYYFKNENDAIMFMLRWT